jgi:type II secretory pathway component PulJ
METDPLIEEIREVRRAISAEFNHDPRRLTEHYQVLERELRRAGQFKFREAPVEKTDEDLALHDKPASDSK